MRLNWQESIKALVKFVVPRFVVKGLLVLCRGHVQRSPIAFGKRLCVDSPLFGWFGLEALAETKFGTRHRVRFPDLIQKFIFFFGVWEPAISRYMVLSLSKGDTFVDVGANVGYHSCLAGRLVGTSGRVHSVEASPSILSELRHSIALNGLDNVAVHHAAASDRAGTLKLYKAASGNIGQSTTSAGIASGPGFQAEAEVPAFPLTEIINERDLFEARIVKIDVEGAEGLVIDGIRDRLAEFSSETEWIVEVWFPSEEGAVNRGEDIIEAFADAGYRCYALPNRYTANWYIREASSFESKDASELVSILPDPRPHDADLLFTRRDYS